MIILLRLGRTVHAGHVHDTGCCINLSGNSRYYAYRQLENVRVNSAEEFLLK